VEIDTTTGALDGEARRHLQTIGRRRWFVVVPLLLGVLAAILAGQGGEDTFVTRSIVRVPDPTQSSVFGTGTVETTSSDTDRIIASAIQLIRGNEVANLVTQRLGEERFDQITLFEVTSLADTLFVNLRVASLDPAVAREASLAFAQSYVAEQGRLDVADLETRATQLRSSADDIDSTLTQIDTDLRVIEREIVILDFEIRALEAVLGEGRVPSALVEATIDRNDFDRDKSILLGERSRNSQEQTFLGQQASNLDIEASYRRQTGAQIVSPPETPRLLRSRSLPRDLVIFSLLGAMLGVAMALVAEYFDPRIKSMRDLHDLAPDIPVLGAVPKMTNLFNQPHLAVTSGRPWYAAEAYRALRTTLLAVYGRRQKSFLFSSVGASAGKSVTVTNLAVSLAKSGFSVLVIDANLRRPSVHMKLGVPNKVGVAQLCANWEDPTNLVSSSGLTEGLDVLPAGPVPENPAELLGAKSIGQLLGWAEANYDWVLVDSPPLDVFTDAAVLAHQVGGVLLVVRFEATDHRRLSETLEHLQTAGVVVLGLIVNGRDPAESRAKRYARGIGVRNVRTLWTDRPPAAAKQRPSPRREKRVGEDQADQAVPHPHGVPPAAGIFGPDDLTTSDESTPRARRDGAFIPSDPRPVASTVGAPSGPTLDERAGAVAIDDGEIGGVDPESHPGERMISPRLLADQARERRRRPRGYGDEPAGLIDPTALGDEDSG